jgi:predicted TIM-barrel enzyme
VRAGTALPVLVGSGVSHANVDTILPLVDGVIVASALKEGGVWWNRVDIARVKTFMVRVRALRQKLGEAEPHR